ncbi:hypothetical protein KUV82_10145 [Qipengyuania flava]|nr:hypothetical protein KUV82_10145 [Qipengyuania flava]
MPAPVIAAPQQVAPAWAPGDDNADRYRRYRYRRHRGIDAGDVLTGVLILGGIAAIASAAKGSGDRDVRRDRRYREPYRGDYRYNDGRGIDRAVSMCVREIERNVRVETVDNVNRSAVGWNVTGSLYNGQGFSCSIGEDGRIEAIDYGNGVTGYSDVPTDYQAGADRQHSDDVYTAARLRTDTAQADYAGGPQPAYPGGPLPGEDPQQLPEYDGAGG